MRLKNPMKVVKKKSFLVAKGENESVKSIFQILAVFSFLGDMNSIYYYYFFLISEAPFVDSLFQTRVHAINDLKFHRLLKTHNIYWMLASSDERYGNWSNRETISCLGFHSWRNVRCYQYFRNKVFEIFAAGHLLLSSTAVIRLVFRIP